MREEKQKRLAVIILNWNGVKLLRQFLPIASEYTIDADTDLYVADNGSTDDSVQWIRNNHPEVKLITLSCNEGFAAGYNIAIERTRYKYTLLLNSDVEVTPHWTHPLLQYMERHPECAACQPKILSYRNRDSFEYAGAAGGLLDCNGYPYCRGRLFDNIENDNGQYDTPATVDIAWASGAAMMVRTDVYERLGGLDPSFFAHQEEIDLCVRMHVAGYTVAAITSSAVYHVGGASLDAANPQKTYLNFRNSLLMLHKNMPPRPGQRLLLRRRLLDILAFIQYIVKGKPSHARAILRAHSDFRKMRRDYKDLPAKNPFKSLPGTDRNIIIDHYILRKKK